MNSCLELDKATGLDSLATKISRSDKHGILYQGVCQRPQVHSTHATIHEDLQGSKTS
jgi:hypothetical protein